MRDSSRHECLGCGEQGLSEYEIQLHEDRHYFEVLSEFGLNPYFVSIPRPRDVSSMSAPDDVDQAALEVPSVWGDHPLLRRSTVVKRNTLLATLFWIAVLLVIILVVILLQGGPSL